MRNLLLHELKYYFRSRQELIYLYAYLISILMAIPFTLNQGSINIQALAGIALWVALASGISIGAAALFRRDQEQGLLEYYQLLPLPLEAVVAAKWLAFFLSVCLPLLAAVPVAGLLYEIHAAPMLRYAIGLSVGALCLSILAVLVAALTNGLEKAGAVLSLILLPLSIPVLIFGAQYCRETTALWQADLWLLLGFALFMLPAMCVAGAYGIRASN